MAVLTHGGDGGGGGYSPEVSPPQPGLHAGGAGGGDGSGPGSARGPRAALAALGAPAASPGSGSGRGRALWHEQGGPLHPRSSPARPWRRRSARPPASPEVKKSLRPATVLHLRNAPKNKPLGAQLASPSVTHASARQSQAAAGPLPHPQSRCQPITRRESDPPAPPPARSQHPHS